MKILQVIDKLDPGGAEQVFVDMSNLLFKGNINVSCLFLLEAGLLSNRLDENIVRTELRRTNKFSLVKMIECVRILRKYDIIHCHMRHVYRYVRILQILFKIQCKVILHDHFGAINHEQVLPLLFSSILRPVFYIGVSDKLTKWAINKLCVKPENTFLLHNIIVKRHTGKVTTRKSDFVIVGNIKEIKNQQFALDIARLSNMSINLIGKSQDTAYFESIEKRIRNYSIDAIIYDNINDVQVNLPQSGFGLCTSFSESGPLVLIEYLAMGIPFLSSDTGEVAKIIKRVLPEFIIEGFNIKSWLDRIQKIKSNNYTSEAIRKQYEQFFNPEEYCKKTLTIYNQICVS